MLKSLAGVQSMLKNLGKLPEEMSKDFGKALRQETEIEVTECKKETPVLQEARKDRVPGALRGSLHAEGPFYKNGMITTDVVAGGPTIDYALVVHEDLDALHEVGGAKYIERPLQASAPHMADRVATRYVANKGGGSKSAGEE